MSLELKTVKTHKANVRYLEGGSGPALVFLHGAGGAGGEEVDWVIFQELRCFLNILHGRPPEPREAWSEGKLHEPATQGNKHRPLAPGWPGQARPW